MLFLVLASLCSAVLTLVLKLFREPKGNRFGIILGNYLTCMLIAFWQLPQKDRLFSVSSSTLLMSVIGGFLFVAGLVLMQTSVAANGAALTAAFSKLGLIVPLLISFLFFREIPSVMNALGLALAAGAIWLLNTGEKSKQDAASGSSARERGSLAILLLTPLACGGSESMAKIFSRLGKLEEDSCYFFFLFLTAALLTFILSVFKKKKSGKSLLLPELAAGILAGVPNYFSSYFLLKALLDLPASVAYPVFSVGSILIVTAAGALLFREKLGRRQLAGLGLILMALILLNL